MTLPNAATPTPAEPKLTTATTATESPTEAEAALAIDPNDPRVEIQRRLGLAGNYNAWIYAQIAPYLGQRVMDVGCALGNITQFFQDRERVIGLDVAPEFGVLFRESFGHLPHYSFLLADFANFDPESLRPERIDTITCLNVLEHIKDDVGALSTMYQILEPGGRLVMLVPAYRALYGSMDAADHHYRRYAAREVRRKLSEAGFGVERVWHMNIPGMLAWLLNGKILRKSLASEGQYGAYNAMVPIFQAIETIISPPIGLSLLAVGRKRA